MSELQRLPRLFLRGPCSTGRCGIIVICADYRRSLTLTVRVVLEALLERHAQHDGDFERSLK